MNPAIELRWFEVVKTCGVTGCNQCEVPVERLLQSRTKLDNGEWAQWESVPSVKKECKSMPSTNEAIKDEIKSLEAVRNSIKSLAKVAENLCHSMRACDEALVEECLLEIEFSGAAMAEMEGIVALKRYSLCSECGGHGLVYVETAESNGAKVLLDCSRCKGKQS